MHKMAPFLTQQIEYDHPHLADLFKLCVGNPTQEKLERVLQQYTQSSFTIWGAFQQTKLMGFIGFERKNNRIIIHHIAVNPASRGKGVGTHLVTSLCQEDNLQEIYAETDKDALGFYKKLHFVCTVSKTKWGQRYQCSYRQNSSHEKYPLSDIDFLTQQIDQETPGYTPIEAFSFFKRDTARQIIAGCNGFIMHNVAYTDQLWVDKAHRKKGIGRDLMEEVHALGREKNCTMATLQTMDFQGAVPFYQELGYKIDFERSGYEKEGTLILMKKDL